jgi:pilus assembly protein CpaE
MSVVYGDAARETERIRLTMTEDVTVFDSLSAMVTFLDDHVDEDMVVVGPDAPLSVATEIAEKYRMERPTLGVILLRRRIEMQTMAEALRSGIREVVNAEDAEALLEACKRSSTVSRQLRHAERRVSDGGNGRVILVFSAKGGCGKTTLSTNLAEALASLNAGKVCLVDFNLTFGDVAIALQIDPTKTISDALGMQGGLDRQGVASMVIPYKENFDVVLAPTQPADAEFISAALAAEILGILTEMYQFVVIDSPPMFSDVVLKCFDVADSYVLLSTLDMLSLKNFKVTIDTLDALGYPRSRWNIVLNRCDSRVGLSADEVERAIGMPIATKLPSSKDVPASLNAGITLVSQSPSHPFSKAVLGLAALQAADSMAEQGTPRANRKRGLFGRKAGAS